MKYFKQYSIYALFMAIILLGSCKKEDNSDFNVTADVRLVAFTINDIAGEIDQKTGAITVNVPFGTDVATLAPAISLPAGANINPASGVAKNFNGEVKYRVTNGNLYKDYKVQVKIIPPLTSFKINAVSGVINAETKSVVLILPDGTDLTNLVPEIEVGSGVNITPATGIAQNFTEPVIYKLTKGEFTVEYHVSVISNSINEFAFLGLANTRAAIVDPDEKAAADWFFSNYPNSDYVSFQNIENGRNLDGYKVIWWHYDAAQDLPEVALNGVVTSALKSYRENGGNLLLTTYAARYVEALGIVPEGKGPNNSFGDFGEAGFVEANNNWGISFRTREDHPIFQGVETYENGKAWLLEKGTFRQNHTAWWYVNEWGGYGDGANWREQTGGINLASESWDDQLNGRVGIAEWKATDGNSNVVIIAFGAYDWYSEPLGGGSTTNAYLGNIKKITKNAIDYLKNN